MLADTLRTRSRPESGAERTDRTIVVVWLARVAMSAGRALAGIATPLYLAAIGFDAFRLGELFVVVSAASVILSAAVGLLSDRIGRRPFLIVFPLLTAGAGVVFATTTATPLLFLAAAAGSFGRGAGAGASAAGPYQPAEAALVTDITSPQRRNVMFGRLAFGSTAGALVGSLLALLAHGAHAVGSTAPLPTVIAEYRGAFLATAAVSLFAGLVALAIHEPPRPARVADKVAGDPPGQAGDPPGQASQVDAGPPGAPGQVDAGPPSAAGQAAGNPAEGGSPSPARQDETDAQGHRPPHSTRALLVRLGITNSVNGLTMGMVGPFITYWFARRYGVGPGEIGLLFAVVNGAALASTLSAAGMARRWGLVRTIVVTRAIQALLLVPMVLAPTFVLAGAAFLVRMVIQRVGLPLRQSYVLAVADPARRSSVAALANIPSQVTMIAGPVITGAMIAEVSLSLPFLVGAGIQLATAGLYWLFFHDRPPEEERVAVPASSDPEIA